MFVLLWQVAMEDGGDVGPPVPPVIIATGRIELTQSYNSGGAFLPAVPYNCTSTDPWNFVTPPTIGAAGTDTIVTTQARAGADISKAS